MPHHPSHCHTITILCLAFAKLRPSLTLLFRPSPRHYLTDLNHAVAKRRFATPSHNNVSHTKLFTGVALPGLLGLASPLRCSASQFHNKTKPHHTVLRHCLSWRSNSCLSYAAARLRCALQILRRAIPYFANSAPCLAIASLCFAIHLRLHVALLGFSVCASTRFVTLPKLSAKT